MKCKEYKESIQKDMDETIDLLNNHPSITGNKYLTDRIMEAVLQPEKVILRRKSYSFEMKLASSFICTGIVFLISNILTMQNNIFFAEGLQQTILSFNDLMAGVVSKLSSFQLFY